jgi:4-amino-4-deoxy-L-arabinose transferase-like glycosyltransferase
MRSAAVEREQGALPSARPQNDTISARRAALLLVLITTLSAFLHFLRLSHPPLWIDECFTFWRVCGSYDQLIETLRDDGFVPLHYELLWLVGKLFPLTPTVMRFIPALCGTLLSPIMYFLARQLFGRRTSLLAALLIASSAYASNYARDAKMYMPAWTFATLAMAGLLWWLRTQRFVAWQVWVAAGVAAAGMHVVTLLLLPLAPILLLTQRRHRWHQALLMLLGIAIVVAGPAGYYAGFNRWTQRSGGLVPGLGSEPASDANWRESGLGWIGGSANGADMLGISASTYFTAYEFRGIDDLDAAMPSHPWVHRWIGYSLIAILVILGLCLLPWPYRWRGSAADAIAYDSADLHLTSHPSPQPSPLRGEGAEDWWRNLLIIASWIVLPSYCFFYCRSVIDFASPSDIVGWVRSLEHPWYCWPATFVWLGLAWWFSGTTMRQRLVKSLQLLAVCTVLFVICSISAAVWRGLYEESMRKYPDLKWHSIFQPRYMGIIVPAVWLATAALLMRLPTRPLRWTAIAILVAINLTNGLARVFADTEPPLDRIYADLWKCNAKSPVRTYETVDAFYMNFLDNPYWRPAGAYSAWLASRMETSPADVRVGKAWPFLYGPLMDRFRAAILLQTYADADRIAEDVSRQPGVYTIIVWEIAPPGEELPTTDPIQEKLGAGWTKSDDERFIFRRYWTWEEITGLRRRQYVKH